MRVKIKYPFMCLLVIIFIFNLVFLSGCSTYLFEKTGGLDNDRDLDYQPSEKTKEEIEAENGRARCLVKSRA